MTNQRAATNSWVDNVTHVKQKRSRHITYVESQSSL